MDGAMDDEEANKGHAERRYCRRPLVLLCVVGTMINFVLRLYAQDSSATDETTPTTVAKKVPTVEKIVRHHLVSPDGNKDEPDLVTFVKRLQDALAPFQARYWTDLAKKTNKNPDSPPGCERGFSKPFYGSYLAGCLEDDCTAIRTLEEAQKRCVEHPHCGGVTSPGVTSLGVGHFELRQGTQPLHSERETSWVRDSCLLGKTPTAEAVWHAFSSALDASLNDSSLHLDTDFGPPKEDDSIFIAISAYRDMSCSATVRRAYEQADRPDRLSVGVIQQNCLAGCLKGTGWGSTRKLVPAKPDADCIDDFCASHEGQAHCKDGRVRILRLGEAAAFGPLFSRYLNAKLWRGESYYLQIDSHTDFRTGWDTTLLDMIKRTPSHPKSVISNYPPSGDPNKRVPWGKLENLEGHGEEVSGPLCGCSFETTNDEDPSSVTVRIDAGSGGDTHDRHSGIPRYTVFMAAGFFFTHGSSLQLVPPDPFLPYIFMGEEIAITIRHWTAGFEIYSPSVDVLKHEYVRKHGTKFWETVNIVFSTDIHNDLTALIIKRIQHLLGVPGRESVKPADLLTRMSDYGFGKVRSADDFVRFMGLDFARQRQTPPQWCQAGKDPPWTGKAHVMT